MRSPFQLITSLLTCLLCAALLPGCLRRTLTITSEPPGALVTLNDIELGRTPIKTDFTFYGKYAVRLRREGFEPLDEVRKLSAPPQEWPVVDLAAEALPFEFHNRPYWHFVLTPVAETGIGDDANAARTEAMVIDRARAFRETQRITSEP